MFRRLVVVALALLVLTPPAFSAVRMQKLYAADIPVTGQDRTERARALRDGLHQVITRISGTQKIDDYPPLAKALQDPSQYVQQYRYHRLPPSAQPQPAPQTAPATAAQPPAAVPTEELRIRFDRAAVNQLLQQSGLPVWGEERPVTLVWLAIEDGGQRRLLSADGTGAIHDALEKQARASGVPILFPLLDLEDQRNVAFADVWGGFVDTVQEASKRYGTEAVLIGRLYRDSQGTWHARWTFANSGQQDSWTADNDDLPTLLGGTMANVADMLIARYALRSDEVSSQPVRLVVSGVKNLQDYARLSKYLNSLAAVYHAELSAVDGQRLTYAVTVRGSASVLEQSFALGNTLAPQPVQSPAPAANAGQEAAVAVPAQASGGAPAAGPGEAPPQAPPTQGSGQATGGAPVQGPGQAVTQTPAPGPGQAVAGAPVQEAGQTSPQGPAQGSAQTSPPAAAQGTRPTAAQAPVQAGAGGARQSGEGTQLAAGQEQLNYRLLP
ncbi:MAG: DUF2066 domain-containing protein [Gammaproteobacteria bacterium]